MTLKVVARCRHPILLADAMKSYHGAKFLSTRDCALKDLELFGSTKWNLELKLNAYCDSHQPDKNELVKSSS